MSFIIYLLDCTKSDRYSEVIFSSTADFLVLKAACLMQWTSLYASF